MERKGVYDIKTVLDWIDSNISKNSENNFKEFDGVEVLSGLLSYSVFLHKGTDCCTCKTVGNYFALERTPGNGRSRYNNWHFNLYGKDKHGKDVLMTKDHIMAKSKGGRDEISNLQPMCSKCNTRKGSMHMYEFQAKQKGQQFSWDMRFAENVMNKLRTRYSINVPDLKEYEVFCNRVAHGETVHRISNTKSYIKATYKNKQVYVVYSSLFHLIYSALDPSKIEEHMMDIPLWGKGREEECVSLYNEIFGTIKRQFKTFPTDKETALYFNDCTYPRLMYGLWKSKGKEIFNGKTLKMHNSIWSEVRNRINVKKEVEETIENFND